MYHEILFKKKKNPFNCLNAYITLELKCGEPNDIITCIYVSKPKFVYKIN